MAYGTPRAPDEIQPYYTDIRRGRPPTRAARRPRRAVRRRSAALSPLARAPRRSATALQAALDATGPGRFDRRASASSTPTRRSRRRRRRWPRPVPDASSGWCSPRTSRRSRSASTSAGRAAAAEPPGIAVRRHRQLGHRAGVRRLPRRRRAPPARGDAGQHEGAVHRPLAAAADPRRRRPVPRRAARHRRGRRRGGRAGTVDAVAVGWQSAGRTPEPWLGPDILAVIDELAAAETPTGCSCARAGSSPTTSRCSTTSTSRPGHGPRARAGVRPHGVVNDDPAVIGALARRVVEADAARRDGARRRRRRRHQPASPPRTRRLASSAPTTSTSRCARPTTGSAASCATSPFAGPPPSTRAPTRSSPGSPAGRRRSPAGRSRRRADVADRRAGRGVARRAARPPRWSPARRADRRIGAWRAAACSRGGGMARAALEPLLPRRDARRLHRRVRPRPLRRRGPRAPRRRARRQHLRRRHRPLQPRHGSPAGRAGRPSAAACCSPPAPHGRRRAGRRVRSSQRRAPGWARWRTAVAAPPGRRAPRSVRAAPGHRARRRRARWRSTATTPTRWCWPRRPRRRRRCSRPLHPSSAAAAGGDGPRRRRDRHAGRRRWPERLHGPQRLPRAQARPADGDGGLVRLAEVGPLARATARCCGSPSGATGCRCRPRRRRRCSRAPSTRSAVTSASICSRRDSAITRWPARVPAVPAAPPRLGGRGRARPAGRPPRHRGQLPTASACRPASPRPSGPRVAASRTHWPTRRLTEVRCWHTCR